VKEGRLGRIPQFLHITLFLGYIALLRSPTARGDYVPHLKMWVWHISGTSCYGEFVASCQELLHRSPIRFTRCSVGSFWSRAFRAFAVGGIQLCLGFFPFHASYTVPSSSLVHGLPHFVWHAFFSKFRVIVVAVRLLIRPWVGLTPSRTLLRPFGGHPDSR